MTDGPYAEVVEGMGGFYLVEAPDLDVLVELLGEPAGVRHAGLPRSSTSPTDAAGQPT